MALAFFRRRQKTVLIIMVLLMVSFLIGIQGVNALLDPNPAKHVLGTTKHGKVTNGDLASARADLDILGRMGLGRQLEQGMYLPTSEAFLMLAMNDELEASFTYAMLLQEAASMGLKPSDRDVKSLLEQIGYTGPQYEALVARLRTDRINERQLRDTMANWWNVLKAFEMAAVSAPPSEQEVRVAYRDVAEGIDLRVLQVPADKYLDQVAEVPSDEMVLRQYNDYRAQQPLTYPNTDSFGFGYRQPARLAIQYMLFDRSAIERVAQPSQQAVRAYYLEHGSEFVKPAGDADANGEKATVVMSAAEARPLVVQRLTDSAVQARMDRLVNRAQNLLEEYKKTSRDPSQAYQWVVSQLVRPADSVLARQVQPVIANEPLETAIALLARAADLEAIAYPWGDHDGVKIDKSVRVTLRPEQPITLGEALERINLQVFAAAETQPASDAAPARTIEWATVAELDDVLLPAGGAVSMLPVRIGTTEPLDLLEAYTHPLLGFAFTSSRGEQRLAMIAFQIFNVREDQSAPVKLNEDGVPMVLLGAAPGRLLWRPVAATPEHEAPAAESVEQIPPAIHTQVVKDIKLRKALEIAADEAAKIAAKAEQVGLEKAGEEAGFDSYTTGMFARRNNRFEWQIVPGLSMPTPELRSHLMQQLFAVAPQDPEPPYPDQPQIKVLKIQPLQSSLVIQRAGYRPLVADEYLKQGSAAVIDYLMMQRRQIELMQWFQTDNVIARLGYQRSED